MHDDNNPADEPEVDLTELSAVIQSEFDDAEDFIDSLGYERAEATEYYKGTMPEEVVEGHSRFVSTDVRDAVNFMMPSLMRIFFGHNRVCEFVPNGPEDIPVAQQQTEYINHLIQKNNGYQVIHAALKDALIRKAGYLKAYFADEYEVTTHEYTDLDEQQVMALQMDADNEIMERVDRVEAVQAVNPETGETVEEDITVGIDVTVRRSRRKDQIVIEALPPEEVLIARNARDLETASYVAHRSTKTVNELVAMGYDYDEVVDYAGISDELSTDSNRERLSRNPLEDIGYNDRPDELAQNVYYVEHFLRYDMDGDGYAERLRVCTIGTAHNVVNVEAWDDLPIVMFSSDPEPHTAIGGCIADYVKPLQLAKSQIMRDTLDSLGHSVFPRYGVVEGQVNMDDVLNTDVGQPIRMRQPGAVQPFTVPFVGQAAFPVIDYLDQLREDRTGVSKASVGLNAESMQSTTAAAINNTISNAQGRIEVTARNLAETGFKALFRLVNRLAIKHMDRGDVFRLRNEFVPVDPRLWDNDKDLIVNVALAGSSDAEKVAFLTMLSSKQEMVMQQMGLDNPLVTPQQYANTLARIVELSGFKDVDTFMNTQMPPSEAFAEPEEAPLPDPAMIVAQAEIEKTRADNQLAREKMFMEDDRKRDELEAETMLKIAELQARYGAQINVAEIKSILERDKEAIRQAAKLQAVQGYAQ